MYRIIKNMFGRSCNAGKWHLLKNNTPICSQTLSINESKLFFTYPENMCVRCNNKEEKDVKMNITKVSRKSVPKALKDKLWDISFGPFAGEAPCYVCQTTINSKRFEAGHIKSVANGGLTTLSNLKCICSTCNKSMGTENLQRFKDKYFSDKNGCAPMEIC